MEVIKLDVEGDGLTLTGALLVFNSRRSGFKSIAIPMDGIKVYQLRPRPFLWLRLLKNYFQKVVLLDINLRTPSHCKNERDKVIRTVVKVLKKNHIHNTTEENIPDGSKIPHVLSTGMKSVSPG